MRFWLFLLGAPALLAGGVHVADRFAGGLAIDAAWTAAWRSARSAFVGEAPTAAAPNGPPAASAGGVAPAPATPAATAEPPPTPQPPRPSAEADASRLPLAVTAPPSLSARAERGADAYARHCAACHGWTLGGGPGGPPLVHPFYGLGAFDDAGIARAVEAGAPERRWPFGPMPAVDGISDRDIAAVIAYVRAAQAHNGVR